MDASALQLSTDVLQGWLIVKALGSLDLTTAERFRDDVTRDVQARVTRHVVVDLSGVLFCDSSGLNALVRVSKTLRGFGGRLVLVAPGELLAMVLHRTGLDSRILVYATVHDAMCGQGAS